MTDCEMCGGVGAVTHRWYQYDNGEQFRANVCGVCAVRHDILNERIFTPR
jgi:hypothetical protein